MSQAMNRSMEDMKQQQVEQWLTRHGLDPKFPSTSHALSLSFERRHEDVQETYCDQNVRYTNRFFRDDDGHYAGQTLLEVDSPDYWSIVNEGPCFNTMVPDDLDRTICPTRAERGLVLAVFGTGMLGLFMGSSALFANPAVVFLSTVVGSIVLLFCLTGVFRTMIPAWRVYRYFQSLDEPVITKTRAFEDYDTIAESSMEGVSALEGPEPDYVNRLTLTVPELDELITRIKQKGARTVAARRREQIVNFMEACRGKKGEGICRRVPLRYKHIGGRDSALIDVHRFNMPGIVDENRSLRLSFSSLHKITLHEKPICHLTLHQGEWSEPITYHSDWFGIVDDREKRPEDRRGEAQQVMLYESRFLLALSSVRDFG